MTTLSDRINHLAESETLEMTRRSRELKSQGLDVINLSIGQPDFRTPQYIKDSGKQAIDDNFTQYSPVDGYSDLKEAISRKFKRDNNLDYAPDQIVVSTGAKQSLSNTILCLINPGDEVLVPAPYWLTYRELIKLAGGIPVYILSTIEHDFKVTPEQVKEAITPKTKLFIFSSPCNPSGSVYSRDELKGLADVFAQHPEISIISDEIYELINFQGKHESIAQFEEIRDRVITVNGVSKGFSMTGWRIGYIGAPKHIAKAVCKMQGQLTSGTCSIAQRAALTAIDADPKKSADLHIMLGAFRERRDLLIKQISEVEGFRTNTPHGAFYLFPNIDTFFGKQYDNKTIKTSMDFCNFLLEKALVASAPGSAFGNPNCIRFSYATSGATLTEAVKRIKEAIKLLK